MIIPIDESKVHKTIKIKARCCSDCGQFSEWLSKKFYVSCKMFDFSFLANNNTLNKKVQLFFKKERCQDIYYTTDGADPLKTSFVYENGIDISQSEKTSKEITIKARLICNDMGQMGEIKKETYYVPSVRVLGNENILFGFNDKVIGFIK